jgi:hypothetical protein
MGRKGWFYLGDIIVGSVRERTGGLLHFYGKLKIAHFLHLFVDVIFYFNFFRDAPKCFFAMRRGKKA